MSSTNKANAQHSTGPRTETGKAASKYNAVRHGLTGKRLLLESEDPAQYEALRLDLIVSYDPANAAELMLVEEIAQNFWRLQRARNIEAENMNIGSGGADPIIAFGVAQHHFDTIRRYMTTIERAWHRAMQQLERTQALRRKLEAAQAPVLPESGFVSQKPEPLAPRVISIAAPAENPQPKTMEIDMALQSKLIHRQAERQHPTSRRQCE